MIDKNRIITMSRLAIYDKKYSEKDNKVTEYFRQDYVYKQNAWTRFFVLLGGIIVLIYDYGKKIFIDQIDILSMDLGKEIRGIIIYLAILLVVYTIIGTIKYNYEYTLCHRRQKKYTALINKLNKITKKKDEYSKGASEL